jgi:hypothetical protein
MVMYSELERIGDEAVQLLYCHLPGRTEKTMKNLNQDSLCPGQDFKWAFFEYKSEVLLLGPNVMVKQLALLHHIWEFTG